MLMEPVPGEKIRREKLLTFPGVWCSVVICSSEYIAPPRPLNKYRRCMCCLCIYDMSWQNDSVFPSTRWKTIHVITSCTLYYYSSVNWIFISFKTWAGALPKFMFYLRCSIFISHFRIFFLTHLPKINPRRKTDWNEMRVGGFDLDWKTEVVRC